jgi:hypothetical protein
VDRQQSSTSTSSGAPRVIIAGADEQLVPLYERLRGEGLARVVALGSKNPDSLTGLLAMIGDLPLLAADEPAPAADLWVCDEQWRARATGVECLDFRQADGRWPVRASGGVARTAQRPLQKIAGEAVTSSLGSSARADFPRELQREIERSKRYHLGFTLSIFRVLDARGRALTESGFNREPLSSFPARQGRVCDSWGLSKEGFLLHLAPETLEQAPSMRRRLVQALEAELANLPGGPWSLITAQVRFPQDSESARELLGLALQRLERKLGEGTTSDDEGDGLEA